MQFWKYEFHEKRHSKSHTLQKYVSEILSIFFFSHFMQTVKGNGKGKVYPLLALCGPEGG